MSRSVSVSTEEVGTSAPAGAAPAAVYLSLKADDRHELRMPALLKEHAVRVASLHGQTTSQYLLSIIAARVAEDMASTATWSLSVPEVLSFIATMMGPTAETAAMRDARAAADDIFGASVVR
jgi:hypothetical protein